MIIPKRRVRVVSGVALTFLAIVANSRTFAQPAGAEPGEVTLRGAVFLEEGNRPATGVVVTAKALESQSSIRFLTDENGVFQLHGLRAGKYELFAEESGYESSRVTVRTEEPATSLRIYLNKSLEWGRNIVSAHDLRIPQKAKKAFQEGKARLDNK